jgi:hypothetical protein
MSRHSSLPAPLRDGIAQRRLLKVIAGLTNHDPIAVARIARAAAAGGADLLDLASSERGRGGRSGVLRKSQSSARIPW